MCWVKFEAKNTQKGYFCCIDTDRTACTQTTTCCRGALYSQVDWKVTENPESTMLRSVRNRTHTCSLGVTLGAGIVLLPQNFSMRGPFSSGPEKEPLHYYDYYSISCPTFVTMIIIQSAVPPYYYDHYSISCPTFITMILIQSAVPPSSLGYHHSISGPTFITTIRIQSALPLS